jgi:hypothetical protein
MRCDWGWYYISEKELKKDTLFTFFLNSILKIILLVSYWFLIGVYEMRMKWEWNENELSSHLFVICWLSGGCLLGWTSWYLLVIIQLFWLIYWLFWWLFYCYIPEIKCCQNSDKTFKMMKIKDLKMKIVEKTPYVGKYDW